MKSWLSIQDYIDIVKQGISKNIKVASPKRMSMLARGWLGFPPRTNCSRPYMTRSSSKHSIAWVEG